MARLIDADELIEIAHRIRLDSRERIEQMIESAPTVDPVKHGYWSLNLYNREWDVCSACRTGTKRREYGINPDGSEYVTEYSYRYCPNCGAKMYELPRDIKWSKDGHWVHGKELSRDYVGDVCSSIHYDGWWCSECGYHFEGKPLWKYCPHCGSRNG